MIWLYVAGYLFVASLFGWWQVAMDNYYGVKPGASKAFYPIVILSLEWPVGIPLAMASVVSGGWGRWPLDKART